MGLLEAIACCMKQLSFQPTFCKLYYSERRNLIIHACILKETYQQPCGHPSVGTSLLDFIHPIVSLRRRVRYHIKSGLIIPFFETNHRFTEINRYRVLWMRIWDQLAIDCELSLEGGVKYPNLLRWGWGFQLIELVKVLFVVEVSRLNWIREP